MQCRAQLTAVLHGYVVLSFNPQPLDLDKVVEQLRPIIFQDNIERERDGSLRFLPKAYFSGPEMIKRLTTALQDPLGQLNITLS